MRFVRVLLSGSLLVSIMSEGFIMDAICIKGLPIGTRFAYCYPHHNYGIWIVVEHESFRELKDGEEIPEYSTPVFERVRRETVQ